MITWPPDYLSLYCCFTNADGPGSGSSARPPDFWLLRPHKLSLEIGLLFLVSCFRGSLCRPWMGFFIYFLFFPGPCFKASGSCPWGWFCYTPFLVGHLIWVIISHVFSHVSLFLETLVFWIWFSKLVFICFLFGFSFSLPFSLLCSYIQPSICSTSQLLVVSSFALPAPFPSCIHLPAISCFVIPTPTSI